MADFTTGRLLASRYAAWALLNLLVGGPALALLSAYDAASDGTLNLQYPIFSTHCWLALMGWCVPSVFALVFWLFPLLKEAPLGRTRIPSLCLLFLVLATLGLPAYLFLSHSGRSSLFILPMAWGLYLVAGILYALVVWQLTARTLRPTATDLGIQAGAVWLLLVLGARVVAALGAMASERHEFLASSDAAIRLAMLFGFVGNTGLALAAAVAPSSRASSPMTAPGPSSATGRSSRRTSTVPSSRASSPSSVGRHEARFSPANVACTDT